MPTKLDLRPGKNQGIFQRRLLVDPGKTREIFFEDFAATLTGQGITSSTMLEVLFDRESIAQVRVGIGSLQRRRNGGGYIPPYGSATSRLGHMALSATFCTRH